MANTTRYGQNAVYGSLAYDFSNTSAYPEQVYGRPLDIPAPPKIKEKVVTRKAPRVKQYLAPTAILGFACAAVLIVFALMAQIQLTMVSNEAAILEARLTELKTEQSRLLINYESAFNLAEIEEYATSSLGMQKPRNDQVFYINGGAPDKAVIFEPLSDKYTFMDRLNDFLSGLGGIF